MSLIGWNALDICFIILGCYFVIRGCFRGFMGEMLTLAGFFCSIYISFKFSSRLGHLLEHLTEINPAVAKLLAIIIVWLAISLSVALLRKMMKGILSAISLGGIDRMLGVLSGIIKIYIVVYVVLIGGLLVAPVLNPTWMTKSLAVSYAGRHWPEVRQILLDFNLLPDAKNLPEGTLEHILTPYIKGGSGYDAYLPRRTGNVSYRVTLDGKRMTC